MTRVNCSDFVAEIGNLLDDEVSPEVSSHLQEHLTQCRACEVVFDSTRKTISILTETKSFELPATELKSGTEGIMARIRALKKQ